MILLLEAGNTFIINLNKETSAESLKEEYSNKRLSYFHFCNLNEKRSITQIFLINPTEHDITSAEIEEYLNNPLLENLSKDFDDPGYFSCIKKYLSNIRIFNRKDLGMNTTDTPLDSSRKPVEDFSYVLRLKGEENLVCHSWFLSPLLAKILLETPDSEIFALSYFDVRLKGSSHLERIVNPKEYLQFFINLEIEKKRLFADYDNIPELYTEAFISVQLSGNRGLDQKFFFSAYSDLVERKTWKILLVGGERYLAEKFILEVQKKLGSFYIYDCSEGDYRVKMKNSGYAFLNIDKLSTNKRIELISKLSGWRHRKKVIVFTSSTNIENFNSHNFLTVRVPIYKDCEKYLNVFLALMIREKNMFGLDGKYIQSLTYYDILKFKSLNQYLKIIPSLSEMDEILENIKRDESITIKPFDVNFWYGFKQYLEAKYIEIPIEPIIEQIVKQIEPVAEQIEQIAEPIELPIIQVSANKEENIFIRGKGRQFKIKFEGQEIILNNNSLDGLFYIYCIIRDGEKEPIHVSRLYELKTGLPSQGMTSMNKREMQNIGDPESNNTKQSNSGFELIDDQAIREVKKEIQELKIDLDFLGETEQKERDKIRKKIKMYQEYLRNSTKPDGRSKIVAEDTARRDQKNKKVVVKAINFAKSQIKGEYPSFFEFLDNSIVYVKGEYAYSYKPQKEISWKLDLGIED